MPIHSQKITDSIKELLKIRGTDEYLCYITGDRKPPQLFATQIHPEIVPFLYKLLNSNKAKRRISLMLYSNGGILEAPWSIVNLIREYSSYFEIIIPYKAHSAATLLTLGADKVIMTPLSSLSPIDPTGNFNIRNENKSIQVEDIFGFVEFAKEKVGLVEQTALASMLSKLVEEVPPSVLGSTNRTQSLIRQIATKMLNLRRNKLSERENSQIVQVLAQKLFSHQHTISRREAKEIGLNNIVYATDKEEDLINNIFGYYKNKLKLEEDFHPETLDSEPITKFEADRAIVCNLKDAYVYKSEITITKGPQPGNINVNNNDLGWVTE